MMDGCEILRRVLLHVSSESRVVEVIKTQRMMNEYWFTAI